MGFKDLLDKIKGRNKKANLTEDVSEQKTEEESGEKKYWGLSVGEDYRIKTPAQAFVTQLFMIESRMSYSFTTSSKELKQLAKRRDEILATYKEQLDEKDSPEEMLREAFDYAKDKANGYWEDFYKYRDAMVYEGTVVNPKTDYRAMDAGCYETVAKQIQTVIEKEQEPVSE